MKENQKSRRDFLKNAAVLSAASALPSAFTKSFAAPARSSYKVGDKVKLACVGIGNQGGLDVESFAKTGLAEFVAFCDVDMGAEQTLKVLQKYPDVPRFQDFRQMFDKMGSQIEAVTIGIPDFAHFPVAMLAMSLGKHVYTEKPMGRTFNEVELMMAAARNRTKIVTQMGNQGHSDANYFQFKAWKEAGIIKDVTAITGHMNSSRRWHGWDKDGHLTGLPNETTPSTLDWDIWQGVTSNHQYHKDYVNGQWRCWYDFGLGALGDWGAHIYDTAHQFLDLGLPYEVSMLRADGHNPYFFPQASTILFKFPARGDMPPVDITWYDGVNNLPPIPAGYGVQGLDPNIPPPSSGKIETAKLNPGKIIYSKELTFKGGSHGSTLSIIPAEKAKEMASKLPQVPQSPSNHYANFLKACMGQEETRSPFAIAGPLSQMFTLGVMSQRLNTKLEFDRKTKKITNNKTANEMLVGAPPRKGWEQYYKMV